jgi:glycogen debranching enzyme
MTPPGFIVTASVDWDETGFVRGGNQFNCGTWMDKVGESSWAGNKGVPATPRDGSAVELVGLSFSAVKWLTDLNEQGLYPFNGVYTTHNRSPNSPFITLKEWSKMIKDNFEKKFWIPMDEEEGLKKEGELAGYIHRRGIYKDSFNSSHKYTDYQLRPNFSIAMAIAPELFTPTNARIALKQVEGMLLGPLGMKTLDPLDWQYNGNYINSVDSNDYKTARGFNYHQGPEWLWVTGYFLRAKLIFASDKKSVTTSICQLLSNHAQALMESSWSGLPELTNENGADCPDSCPVQAWSMATLLDLLHDLSVK